MQTSLRNAMDVITSIQGRKYCGKCRLTNLNFRNTNFITIIGEIQHLHSFAQFLEPSFYARKSLVSRSDHLQRQQTNSRQRLKSRLATHKTALAPNPSTRNTPL